MRRKDATGRSQERGQKDALIVPRSARVIVAIAVGAAAYALPLPVSTAEDAKFARDASVEEAWIDALPSGESAAAAARCPDGQRVTGGGVGTTGPVSAGLDYTVEVSGPLDDTGSTANTDDGDVAVFWYASVHNTSGSPQDFKVFALCSTIDARIEAQVISDLPSGQSAAAIARCPSARLWLGGGVGTTGPVSAGLDYTVELSGPWHEFGPLTFGWNASVYNSSGSTQEFRVFALCVASSSTVNNSLSRINDVPSGQSGATAVSCPEGRRLDGGGVGLSDEAVGGLSAGLDYTVELSGPLDETGSTANTDDLDAASFWYASIHNHSGGPQDFDVWAICPASDATIQAETFRDSPPSTPGGGGGGGGGSATAGVPAPCAGNPATIVGTSEGETLTGTADADVIAGLGGNDVLKGLGADDRICGGPGKDRLSGGAGADFLTGGPAADRIFGGPGRDRIIGGPGNDSCTGGPAVDKVSGC